VYYLFGHDSVVDILRARCGGLGTQDLSDPSMLQAYNRFLAGRSIIESPVDWYGPRMVDFPALEAYAPSFCMAKRHHFAINSELLSRRLLTGYFESALDGLERKEPYIAEIVRFCVRLIVINQLDEYTNGTTEDTIGVANFNFKDQFDELDFQELLFHQLVHMLLFIDDSMHPHMPDSQRHLALEVGLPFVLGGTAFPAYLAFHSYIVAVEMLAYRARTDQWGVVPKYHRSTERVLRIISAFRSAIEPEASRFTPRGGQILSRARGLVDDCLATQPCGAA
jgi:hypothetical protein